MDYRVAAAALAAASSSAKAAIASAASSNCAKAQLSLAKKNPRACKACPPFTPKKGQQGKIGLNLKH